jgi:hypothetical protein
MEFLSRTYLETTTQIAVNTSTITAQNIMDPDVKLQYVSDAYNSDSLTVSLVISFDSTQTVDRISLMEFNGKKFNVYYNGVTANAFTIANPTTTTQFLSNTAENIYLAATTPIACTSVSIDIYSTQVANQEKAIGYLYIGMNELTFERIPNASSYTPLKDPKEFVHEMSDGGTRSHRIKTKWAAKIKFKYLSETFRNNLFDIWDTMAPYVFVPFGTGTGWDGVLYEANWVGNFDFYKFSDDATVSGFSGSIDLKET